MIDHWLLEHPRSIGETYFAHQRKALFFSASLFVASAACFIHALVPALFQSTASRTVALLHGRMIAGEAERRIAKLAAQRPGDPFSGSSFCPGGPHKH